LYLSLTRRGYNHIIIKDLLTYSSMCLHEVEDEGHWFTPQQVDLFYERLLQLTGNNNIAREAGRFAASPYALGNPQKFVIGMTGPAKLLQAVQSGAEKLTRSATFQSQMRL